MGVKCKWDLSKPDGTYQKLLNIERISQLGWTHKTKLEDGIKKTINYYRKNN